LRQQLLAVTAERDIEREKFAADNAAMNLQLSAFQEEVLSLKQAVLDAERIRAENPLSSPGGTSWQRRLEESKLRMRELEALLTKKDEERSALQSTARSAEADAQRILREKNEAVTGLKASLEAQVARFSEQLTVALEGSARKDKVIADLEARATAAESRRDTLQGENDRLRGDVTSTQNVGIEADKLRMRIRELETRLSERAMEVEAAKNTVSGLANEVADLHAELSSKREELAFLREGIENKHGQLEARSEDAKAMRDKLIETSSALAALTRQLEEADSRMQQERQEAAARILQVERRCLAAESLVSESGAVMEDLRTQLMELTASLEETTTHRDRLVEAKARLESALTVALRDKEAAEAAYSAASNTTDRVSGEATRLVTAAQSLSDELSVTRAREGQQGKELEEAMRELRELRNAYADTAADRSLLRSTVDALKIELAAYRDAALDPRSSMHPDDILISRLKASFKAAQAEAEANGTRAMLETQRAEHAMQRAANAEQAFHQMTDSLHNQRQSSREHNAQDSMENAALRAKMIALQRDLSETRTQLAVTLGERETLLATSNGDVDVLALRRRTFALEHELQEQRRVADDAVFVANEATAAATMFQDELQRLSRPSIDDDRSPVSVTDAQATAFSSKPEMGDRDFSTHEPFSASPARASAAPSGRRASFSRAMPIKPLVAVTPASPAVPEPAPTGRNSSTVGAAKPLVMPPRPPVAAPVGRPPRAAVGFANAVDKGRHLESDDDDEDLAVIEAMRNALAGGAGGDSTVRRARNFDTMPIGDVLHALEHPDALGPGSLPQELSEQEIRALARAVIGK
jgi:hypothetical protein